MFAALACVTLLVPTEQGTPDREFYEAAALYQAWNILQQLQLSQQSYLSLRDMHTANTCAGSLSGREHACSEWRRRMLLEGHGGLMSKGDQSKTEINSEEFYANYYGHTMEMLDTLETALRASSSAERTVIWLVGDSTGDNKFWVAQAGGIWRQAVNGYQNILSPPLMKGDVAFWMNSELVAHGAVHAVAINAAVEESAIGAVPPADGRSNLGRDGPLIEWDSFVHTRMQPQDIVVVTLGGNDVALWPSQETISAFVSVILGSSEEQIDAGTAPGMDHIISIFGLQQQRFLEKLVNKTRPRAVVLCMLYYVDKNANASSWAAPTLQFLNYNSQEGQGKLNLLYRKVFELGISKVSLEGVPVVPVALFQAMDGTDTNDYVARVEPSSQGGSKLAKLIVDAMDAEGLLTPFCIAPCVPFTGGASRRMLFSADPSEKCPSGCVLSYA
mmetsp:Transcript_44811/g.74366  ORF Transcript_44811/g.74366 Transcript_44811/m.74366 type:complete len:444 (+) Transcript_44811:232-1563(+)